MPSKQIKFIAISAIVAAGLSASGMYAKAQTSPSEESGSLERSSSLLDWSEWSERTFFNVYTGFFRTQPIGAPSWIEHNNVGGYEDNNISCPATWIPTIELGEYSCRRPEGTHNRMFVSEIRFRTTVAGSVENCSVSFQALASSEVTLEQFKLLVTKDVDSSIVEPPFSLDMLGTSRPYSYSTVIQNPKPGIHYMAIRVSCGDPTSTFSLVELQTALRATGFPLPNP